MQFKMEPATCDLLIRTTCDPDEFLKELKQTAITKFNYDISTVVTSFAFNMLVTVHFEEEKHCDCQR